MASDNKHLPPLPGAIEAGMLLVSFQIPEEAQPGFNEWYNREHIPARIGLGAGDSGFQATTRYLVQGAVPRYVNMYELGTADFLKSQEYLAVRDAEAAMPLVVENSENMRAHGMFGRRIMNTWVREQIPVAEAGRGPMVLETYTSSDEASRKTLLSWVVPAYFGTAGRTPDVAYAIVGLSIDSDEVVFMTGYRNGSQADWTRLNDGVARRLLEQIDPTGSSIQTDVALPLAYFGPNT